MKLRVEFVWDDEGRGWGYRVPALHIVGSGTTREDAERDAVEAVKFVLEGSEGDFHTDEHIKVGYIDVDVRPEQPAAAKRAG